MKKKLIFMLSVSFLLLFLFGMTADSIEKQNVPNFIFSSMDVLESFFEETESGNVEIVVTDAKNPQAGNKNTITSVSMGSVIKVRARFGASKPKGTYIFYVKPDTGEYENAMIYKGYVSGINDMSGIETYFYIPPLGQMVGTATIYAYIPGHGVGKTTIEVKN